MADTEQTIDTVAEEKSKDECYSMVADVANELMSRHGKDFTMGTLVLAARFIAEGKPLSNFTTGD